MLRASLSEIRLRARSRRVETICNVTNLDILLRCKMFCILKNDFSKDVLNFQMHSPNCKCFNMEYQRWTNVLESHINAFIKTNETINSMHAVKLARSKITIFHTEEGLNSGHNALCVWLIDTSWKQEWTIKPRQVILMIRLD